MIISFDYRFVFVHVHKTAGESITSTLVPFVGKHAIVKADVMHALRDRLHPRRHREVDQLSKHSTAGACRSALGDDAWNDFFTFAFVREPIARAGSLYTYIEGRSQERTRHLPRNLWYATLASYDSDPAHWPAMTAYRESSSFSEFIRHPAALADAAMRSQSSSLCDAEGNLLVDCVGHVERIDADFLTVTRSIGLPALKLQWTNRSSRTLADGEVTACDRAYLHRLFAEDYVRFGY